MPPRLGTSTSALLLAQKRKDEWVKQTEKEKGDTTCGTGSEGDPIQWDDPSRELPVALSSTAGKQRRPQPKRTGKQGKNRGSPKDTVQADLPSPTSAPIAPTATKPRPLFFPAPGDSDSGSDSGRSYSLYDTRFKPSYRMKDSDGQPTEEDADGEIDNSEEEMFNEGMINQDIFQDHEDEKENEEKEEDEDEEDIVVASLDAIAKQEAIDCALPPLPSVSSQATVDEGFFIPEVPLVFQTDAMQAQGCIPATIADLIALEKYVIEVATAIAEYGGAH